MAMTVHLLMRNIQKQAATRFTSLSQRNCVSAHDAGGLVQNTPNTKYNKSQMPRRLGHTQRHVSETEDSAEKHPLI